jgi:hypothetical protein
MVGGGLRGIVIDRSFIDGRACAVIDYKTSSHSSGLTVMIRNASGTGRQIVQ